MVAVLARAKQLFFLHFPNEKAGDRLERLTGASFDEGKGLATPDFKALDFPDWRYAHLKVVWYKSFVRYI